MAFHFSLRRVAIHVIMSTQMALERIRVEIFGEQLVASFSIRIAAKKFLETLPLFRGKCTFFLFLQQLPQAVLLENMLLQ